MATPKNVPPTGDEMILAVDQPFYIRAYLTKQLAAFYGMSPGTFSRRIAAVKAKMGPRVSYYFTPRQVSMIIDYLGFPPYRRATTQD